MSEHVREVAPYLPSKLPRPKKGVWSAAHDEEGVVGAPVEKRGGPQGGLVVDASLGWHLCSSRDLFLPGRANFVGASKNAFPYANAKSKHTSTAGELKHALPEAFTTRSDGGESLQRAIFRERR